MDVEGSLPERRHSAVPGRLVLDAGIFVDGERGSS
jgi:hypothetical protein